jgi:hypothetical protein
MRATVEAGFTTVRDLGSRFEAAKIGRCRAAELD